MYLMITLMLGICAMTANAAGRIYVYDQTGWEHLKIYAWATGQPELFGPFVDSPELTLTETVSANTYKYINVTSEVQNVEYKLIFHNGAGEQFDAGTYKVGETVWLYLVKDDWRAITDNSKPESSKPGALITIRAKKPTEWDAMKIWAWKETQNYTGGTWPGLDMADNGNDWFCFNVPVGASVIFNNGSDKQTANIDNVDGTKAYDVKGDGTYTEQTEGVPATLCTANPVLPEETDVKFTIMAKRPEAWKDKDLYAYVWAGDSKWLGVWPGTKMEPVGEEWFKVVVEAKAENNYIIFNNGSDGEGNQIDAPGCPYSQDVCFEIQSTTDCATADCNEIPTSLQSLEYNSLGVSVYPNPASSVIILSATQQLGQATVIDLTGKAVRSFTINAKSGQISVADLNEGMYLLRLTTAEGEQILRNIIKQ